MRPDGDPIDVLTKVLARTCRQLGEAGRPAAAGRLAADAWVVLRHDHARQAAHLDGVMHHLARLEQRAERDFAPTTAQHTQLHTELHTERKDATMPTEDRILDVRAEAPKRRHELIFESFGELATGERYVLVNDHDPKPLRYQFEAENAGEFSWDYLEEGPEVWRVRIGRIGDPAPATSS